MTLQRLAKLTLAKEIFSWTYISVDLVIVEVYHDVYVIFENIEDKIYVNVNGIEINRGWYVRGIHLLARAERALNRELKKAKLGKPPYDLKEGSDGRV